MKIITGILVSILLTGTCLAGNGSGGVLVAREGGNGSGGSSMAAADLSSFLEDFKVGSSEFTLSPTDKVKFIGITENQKVLFDVIQSDKKALTFFTPEPELEKKPKLMDAVLKSYETDMPVKLCPECE